MSTPPPIALTTKQHLQILAELSYTVMGANGTTRDKVTVIGRDQIGLLGQTDGTKKNPMWVGVNGTPQEKVVRDCESQQIFKWDWEWNDEILMERAWSGQLSINFWTSKLYLQ